MTDGTWIPGSSLTPVRLRDIQKGELVLRRPHGRERTVALGVRFDVGEGRWLYPLTGEFGPQGRPGAAVEISPHDEIALRVDLPFEIEADLSKPLSGWGMDDPRGGELVGGASGLALVARIGPAMGWSRAAPVSLRDWTLTGEEGLHTVFGGWRLRLDIGAGVDPVWLRPDLGAPA